MPITTYTSYTSESNSPRQILQTSKNSLTVIGGRLHSAWNIAPFAGANPTTAAVCTSATAGNVLPDYQNSASISRLLRAEISISNAGALILCDRLSHQGGLSGIVTTAQTTNLPTAALTRYTDGVGVFAALEIYTQIGTTATTVTVSYTNQAGTAGRTSIATVFGGTAFREANRFIILPLASGDTGVRSVESVTVLATTGTAGAFGVTLFKPLAVYPVYVQGQQATYEALLNSAGNVCRLFDNACPFFLINGSGTSSGILQGTFHIAEE